MSYGEVMNLPIRSFWLMSGNINRLFAERDMRLLSLTLAANNQEGVDSRLKSLTEELGRVTKFSEADEVYDSEAMNMFLNSL